MANDFNIKIQNAKKILMRYQGNEQNVNIPDGVNVIWYAFNNCLTISSVHIPGSVTDIGEYAFHNCEKLASVVIDEGLRVIGRAAFFDCPSLSTVLIPTSITEIGDRAFACCTNLSYVTIPKRVKKIGVEAFRGCHRLEISIYYHHVYSLEPYTVGTYILNKSPDYYNKTIYLLDDENRKIGKLFILDVNLFEPDRDFASRMMRGLVNHLSEYDSLVVSSNKPVIGKVKAAIYRLEYPLELEEEYKKLYISYLNKNAHLVIPTLIEAAKVELIHVLASLSVIKIENINDYIDVANKYSQTEILATLLDYMNKISKKETHSPLSLDYNRPSLEWEIEENEDGILTITKYLGKNFDVSIPSMINGKKVRSIEGSIGSLKVSVFFQHKDCVKSILIENGIGVIGERAFLECRNLISVEIPTSVTVIGMEALFGCKSLTSVVIPREVKKIGENAFIGCDNLVIHSPKDSYAIEHAKKNGIKYAET